LEHQLRRRKRRNWGRRNGDRETGRGSRSYLSQYRQNVSFLAAEFQRSEAILEKIERRDRELSRRGPGDVGLSLLAFVCWERTRHSDRASSPSNYLTI
jgi:hypothetical protein